MRDLTPGWMVKGKFICSDCMPKKDIPKTTGFAPWKEPPKESWVVRSVSECVKHSKHKAA